MAIAGSSRYGSGRPPDHLAPRSHDRDFPIEAAGLSIPPAFHGHPGGPPVYLEVREHTLRRLRVQKVACGDQAARREYHAASRRGRNGRRLGRTARQPTPCPAMPATRGCDAVAPGCGARRDGRFLQDMPEARSMTRHHPRLGRSPRSGCRSEFSHPTGLQGSQPAPLDKVDRGLGPCG